MAYEVYRSPGVTPPTNLDMNSPEWADYQQRIAADQAAGRAVSDRNAAKSDGGITKWLPKLAYGAIGTAATAGLAPVLGSMFTGGGAPVSGAMQAAGAATSPAASSATAAAKTGIGGRLASIFTNPATSALVNAGTSYLANRSQNKANDQARRDTLAANAEALALQRQQLEMEMTNANLDREDARAAQAAMNELRKRELDAAEEVRAFDREQAQYVRAKDEASEARRAPYREAGTKALARLNAIWGI